MKQRHELYLLRKICLFYRWIWKYTKHTLQYVLKSRHMYIFICRCEYVWIRMWICLENCNFKRFPFHPKSWWRLALAKGMDSEEEPEDVRRTHKGLGANDRADCITYGYLWFYTSRVPQCWIAGLGVERCWLHLKFWSRLCKTIWFLAQCVWLPTYLALILLNPSLVSCLLIYLSI